MRSRGVFLWIDHGSVNQDSVLRKVRTRALRARAAYIEGSGSRYLCIVDCESDDVTYKKESTIDEELVMAIG